MAASAAAESTSTKAAADIQQQSGKAAPPSSSSSATSSNFVEEVLALQTRLEATLRVSFFSQVSVAGVLSVCLSVVSLCIVFLIFE